MRFGGGFFSQGGFLTVFKTADETITNDDVLTDDADLQFPVDANGVYAFMLMTVISGNITPGFKHAFSIPAGAVGRGNHRFEFYAGEPSATYEMADLTVAETTGAGGLGEDNFGLILGMFRIGATPGTVAYQWAQGTSNALSTSLLDDSWMMFKKLN